MYPFCMTNALTDAELHSEYTAVWDELSNNNIDSPSCVPSKQMILIFQNTWKIYLLKLETYPSNRLKDSFLVTIPTNNQMAFMLKTCVSNNNLIDSLSRMELNFLVGWFYIFNVEFKRESIQMLIFDSTQFQNLIITNVEIKFEYNY